MQIDLLCLTLLSMAPLWATAAEPDATGRGVPPLAETSVLLNLYDLQRTTVLQSAVDALAPLVRPADGFILVSGNHKGTPDLGLVAQWAAKLHARFPDNAVWVLTSGLANVKALAAGRNQLPACVTTIVYDYEPKWDNEPEFDPDFARTILNYTRAAQIAHDAGLKLVGAPTGRPLLKAEFARYGWDYGKLVRASGADGMLVQTQTYAKKGMGDFREALARLKAQQSAAGLAPNSFYPQLTVDLNSINGIPASVAVECAGEIHSAKFDRISLWLAPARVDCAVEFLKGLGRQARPH